MRREIAIDGKSHHVEVNDCRFGSPFSVKVDDKTVEVMLKQEPKNSEGFSIRVNGKSYRVKLSNKEKSASFSVKVNEVPFRVEVKSVNAAPRIILSAPSLVSMQIQKPTTTKAQGEGVIAAPMAGRIISVRVKKGDTVKVGSVLCVLEAMKMENEITAPKSGIVEEVKAQEGKAVNEGDLLMLIK